MTEGATFTKRLVIRVSEGMMKLLEDLARREGASVSEVVRGLLNLALSGMATDEYYLIDRVNKAIEETEAQLRKLKELREQLLASKGGKSG